MADVKKMVHTLKESKYYDRLSQWEKDFILSIPMESRRLSGRQITKLYDIYNKVVKS